MLKEVFEFVKNLDYLELEGISQKEKIRYLLKLTAIAVITGVLLGFLVESISAFVGFSMEEHAAMEMLDTMPPIIILLAAVIAAPLFEELIFRAPLGLFKTSPYFKYAYYASFILFGLVHITNFPNMEGYYWLIPVLVAPQIVIGVYLGFIRVKLGLLWSMLLHATYNLILAGPVVVMKMLDIPFE